MGRFDIYLYVDCFLMVNLGKFTIHGCYGFGYSSLGFWFVFGRLIFCAKTVQNKKRHCGAHLEATDMEEILKVKNARWGVFGVGCKVPGMQSAAHQPWFFVGKWGKTLQ